MIGAKVLDQIQQNQCFVFLANQRQVGVVGSRVAAVGLVKQDHVEQWLQAAQGLAEGGGGGQ